METVHRLIYLHTLKTLITADHNWTNCLCMKTVNELSEIICEKFSSLAKSSYKDKYKKSDLKTLSILF